MQSFKNFTNNSISKQAIEYHIKNNIPLDECIFRYGSENFFEFYNDLRNSYVSSTLFESYTFSEDELELIESDLGQFDYYDGMLVALDFIIEESQPELNKPKRGGTKKFYVYVRDPNTGNIKKIEFGDTTGLSVKYNNPERKKAFGARHNCAEKNDKTKPGYWACRINKYMGKTPKARAGFW